jgi:UDP-N-acetylmuramoyl-L-alanyl-D-glutamate--2,6-diaminopimelate ligase
MTRELAPLVAVLHAPHVIGTLPHAIETPTADSRAVVPGTLFVAMRGEHVDGHDFAGDAVARGAVVLLVERALPVAVAQIVVADTRVACSRLAHGFYGQPSRALDVVGITGTNGKTTTSYLVQAICDAAARPCAVLGTLGGTFGDATWPLENTTPLALDLHRILAEMRDRGARAVAMEVSSHALELHRVDDVRFAVGALTNITRDHLDFHETFERYVAAKRRLFGFAPHAVLNADDPAGVRFAAELDAATTYGIEQPATLRATELELRGDGSRFRIGELHVKTRLPGRFNVHNALAAVGVARALGIGDDAIRRGLAAMTSVPGRMERIAGDGIDAIVDYAHTPDALANVLRAARETTRGRLVAVFGCGGDRDPGKRGEMGRIAVALADRVIVTSDNPRSEDPAAIARAVAGSTGAQVILDRRTAIRTALAEARSGDTVVVAGKGHEPYQIVGSERLAFDDRTEVRAAFAGRPAGAL